MLEKFARRSLLSQPCWLQLVFFRFHSAAASASFVWLFSAIPEFCKLVTPSITLCDAFNISRTKGGLWSKEVLELLHVEEEQLRDGLERVAAEI
jgi:hypothetical protein